MLPCAYKSIFGIDCPACGIQRSGLALLNGDIVGSLEHYPAFVPVIILIFLTLLWLLKIKFVSSKLLKNYSIFTLVLIIFSYIIKMIRFYLI
jgi:hypothetical protein